jgi:glucose-1-phosphate thymidylyltransferase
MSMTVCGVLVVEDVRPGDVNATSERLQALEHVANRPIAHHVIDGLEAAGVDEMVVVSSDELADVVAKSVKARVGAERRPIRQVGYDGPVELDLVLPLVAPLVGRAPCILHTASGLLGESLAPSARLLHAHTPDVVAFVHQGSAIDRRLSQATQEMLHLAELDPQHAALGMTGVWLFGPNALRVAASAEWRTSPEVDLTEVASRISDAGGNFDVQPVDTWRSYRGDPADLLGLNRIALDRLPPQTRRTQRPGNQIEGRVWIHPQASVESSVIVGPAVIDEGARISDAYIGPYTSIGAGGRVEGAEIERSIIAPGASVLHVGDRLVSSVVGRNAKIFREFGLPRALRLRVGEGTEVALC